ncbi:MAG: CobW family GTP-binding protein [Fimbriimonadales bacterium]|nr:CobW family GTP-binding protein [Fimbriimonadales bacterium]
MTPLILVCGFLGAGKTTLLRHWARTERNRRVAYVVNEFSSRDVDSIVLAAETSEVVPLPGGSIFCRCLAADFRRTMEALAAREWHALVAEASGIADPTATRTLLRETRLDGLFSLDRVICLVDPATFWKLRRTLPAVEAQVASADTLAINKADLHDEYDLSGLERELRAMNPTADIVRTVRAALPFPAPAARERPALERAMPDHPDDRVVRHELRLPDAVQPEALVRLSDQVGEGLLRAKGFFHDGRGLVAASFDGHRWEFAAAPDGAIPSLVALALRESEPALRRALAMLLENPNEP